MSGKPLSLVIAVLLGTALPVPSAVQAADGNQMRIPRRDCQQLVQYRPDPGVAYKPGVDVRGRPVAPADMPGSGISVEPPDQVTFEINFDPLKGENRFRYLNPNLYVGTVVYDLSTGQATFNGVPLTDPEKDEIAERCRAALRR